MTRFSSNAARLTIAMAILSPTATAQSAADAVALRGVVFAHPWKFDEAIEFSIDGKPTKVSCGVTVGLVVDPNLFRAQGRPLPLIFADGTIAIYRGGPWGDVEKGQYVVVQLPNVDLTKTHFWIGPREPAESMTAERVTQLQAQSQKQGQRFGPLTPGDVTASRRVIVRPPARNGQELRQAALEIASRSAHELRVVPLPPSVRE